MSLFVLTLGFIPRNNCLSIICKILISYTLIMVYIIHSIYENGIYRKELILTLIICLINIVKPFVQVKTPEPYLLVPKNSDVKLICTFTDDQKAKLQELTISWKKEEERITKGIETFWNEKDQIGTTILKLNNVTEKDEGEYTCIVLIRESFDYKKIQLQTFNATHSKTGSKVSVIPSYKDVDMWNGPPLKINCTFEFKEWCDRSVKVDWWKLNTTSHTWRKQITGVSWWSNGWEGKGWLNISDPKIGKTEGIFMCIVKCMDVGNYGIRNVKVVPHIGPDIKPQHGVYSATKGMNVIMVCNVNNGIYTEYGWWFNKNLSNGGRYTLKSTANTIEIIIKNVSNKDNGQYICWVSKDDWWQTNSVTLYITN